MKLKKKSILKKNSKPKIAIKRMWINLTQKQNDTPFNFGRLARILRREKRKKKKEKTIRASSPLLH
jgi:hypothetical protein